jgi:hypothetical protein
VIKHFLDCQRTLSSALSRDFAAQKQARPATGSAVVSQIVGRNKIETRSVPGDIAVHCAEGALFCFAVSVQWFVTCALGFGVRRDPHVDAGDDLADALLCSI